MCDFKGFLHFQQTIASKGKTCHFIDDIYLLIGQMCFVSQNGASSHTRNSATEKWQQTNDNRQTTTDKRQQTNEKSNSGNCYLVSDYLIITSASKAYKFPRKKSSYVIGNWMPMEHSPCSSWKMTHLLIPNMTIYCVYWQEILPTFHAFHFIFCNT